MARPQPVLLAIAVSLACGGARDSSRASDTPTALDTQHAAAPQERWQTRRLDVAPRRFRPGGWSDENTLWGLLRGRVTSLDVRTGALRAVSDTAWGIQAASGVTSWHTRDGVWVLRDGASPVRLSNGGGLAPTSVLWSRDGTRALLTWEDDGPTRKELLDADGSRRAIEVRLPGYYADRAVLWLDSVRVLFQTVALGPVGGEPAYRESGWRGNLAVLDLRTGAYTLVAGGPDLTYLRVAGSYRQDVLVTEWDRAAVVRAHWLYDTRTWTRRPMSVPRGRAYSSAAGAVVVLLDAQADSTTAVLIAGGDTTALGRVARDAEPAFSPSGRVGSLHTAGGVMIFEQKR